MNIIKPIKSIIFLIIIICIFSQANVFSSDRDKAFKLFFEYKFEDALLIFNKLIIKDNKDPELLYFRSNTYFHLQKFDKAFDDINKSIRLNPKNPDYIFFRASLYMVNGKVDKALKDVDVVIKLKPKDSDSYTLRANIKFSLGKYTDAENDFRKASELNPKNDTTKAYIPLCKCNQYINLGMFELAEKYCNEALEIVPGVYPAYSGLGTIKFMQNQLDKALYYFEKGVESYSRNHVCIFGIGMVYYKKGDTKKACYYWQKAADLGFVEAQYNINEYCK